MPKKNVSREELERNAQYLRAFIEAEIRRLGGTIDDDEAPNEVHWDLDDSDDEPVARPAVPSPNINMFAADDDDGPSLDEIRRRQWEQIQKAETDAVDDNLLETHVAVDRPGMAPADDFSQELDDLDDISTDDDDQSDWGWEEDTTPDSRDETPVKNNTLDTIDEDDDDFFAAEESDPVADNDYEDGAVPTTASELSDDDDDFGWDDVDDETKPAPTLVKEFAANKTMNRNSDLDEPGSPDDEWDNSDGFEDDSLDQNDPPLSTSYQPPAAPPNTEGDDDSMWETTDLDDFSDDTSGEDGSDNYQSPISTADDDLFDLLDEGSDDYETGNLESQAVNREEIEAVDDNDFFDLTDADTPGDVFEDDNVTSEVAVDRAFEKFDAVDDDDLFPEPVSVNHPVPSPVFELDEVDDADFFTPTPPPMKPTSSAAIVSEKANQMSNNAHNLSSNQVVKDTGNTGGSVPSWAAEEAEIRKEIEENVFLKLGGDLVSVTLVPTAPGKKPKTISMATGETIPDEYQPLAEDEIPSSDTSPSDDVTIASMTEWVKDAAEFTAALPDNDDDWEFDSAVDIDDWEVAAVDTPEVGIQADDGGISEETSQDDDSWEFTAEATPKPLDEDQTSDHVSIPHIAGQDSEIDEDWQVQIDTDELPALAMTDDDLLAEDDSWEISDFVGSVPTAETTTPEVAVFEDAPSIAFEDETTISADSVLDDETEFDLSELDELELGEDDSNSQDGTLSDDNFGNDDIVRFELPLDDQDLDVTTLPDLVDIDVTEIQNLDAAWDDVVDQPKEYLPTAADDEWGQEVPVSSTPEKTLVGVNTNTNKKKPKKVVTNQLPLAMFGGNSQPEPVKAPAKTMSSAPVQDTVLEDLAEIDDFDLLDETAEEKAKSAEDLWGDTGWDN